MQLRRGIKLPGDNGHRRGSRVSPLRKPSIQLRESGFLVRTMLPGDACTDYQDWIADPELMGPLNMPARRLTISQLQDHISGFDNKLRHLLGLFDETDGKLIGIVLLDFNTEHRTARFSVLVGNRDYWGDRRIHPLARAFQAYLFERKGIEKLRCQIGTDNHRMIGTAKLMGLKMEGLLRGEIRSTRDGSRIDQFVFGLLKTDWQAQAGR